MHNSGLKAFYKMLNDCNSTCQSTANDLKSYIESQNRKREELISEKSEILTQLVDLQQVVGSSVMIRRLISINNQLEAINVERTEQRALVSRAFDISNSLRRRRR